MVSIVIPAFNEEAATEKVLVEVCEAMSKSSLVYEIIFVDDGSYDRTTQIVSQFSKVRLIRCDVNKGVGAARKIGLREAKGDAVVMIDADGTYPATVIPKLVQGLEKYDMLIGWRQKEIKSPFLLYRLMKLVMNKTVSLLMGTRVLDLNSGLRVFKKEIAVKFLNILPNGHSWVSTLTISFLANGYSVGYIPIYCRQRLGKSSFLFWNDGWRSLVSIIKAIIYFKMKNKKL